MPCYDPRDADDAAENAKRVDQLTDLLCMAGRAHMTGEPVPLEVLRWWKEHQTRDDGRGCPWGRNNLSKPHP